MGDGRGRSTARLELNHTPHSSRYNLSNGTYCEMLLGFVVLIEVDAGSAVLVHDITGQELSEGQNTHTHTHQVICKQKELKLTRQS